ncbi:MAG: hypothetical protein AAB510_01475 [Patescibacteria group bacterium]
MNNENERKITNSELLEVIIKGFSKIEEKMATKTELEAFKLEANIHFNNLETDLKSFKNETRDNFKELNEKFDDLSDTVMNHNKRIEALEEKVL